jgi:predicted enzyme related to lactoylglutathione lyase
MNTTKLEALGASSLLAVSLAAPVCAQTEAAPRHAVVHIEILGADAPRLQGFYRDLFGWTVTLNPVGYGYVPIAPATGTPLTGGVGASPQRQPLVTFYVKVDDPSAILKKVESLGGKVLVAPTDVPGGVTFARFADPEGNVVGVVRRPN